MAAPPPPPASPPNARALARQLAQHGPDATLTAQIAACACGPAVRAGLFLRNGDWVRAHEVSQSLHDAVGAHWHALVHRHEPDYANSKYWLRRVGDSPLYPRLLAAAQAAGHGAAVSRDGRWDAARFTDCFAHPAHRDWTGPLDALEIELLLEHCLTAEA